MKRIAYSLIALAIAAFTFSSCEDVPSPFGTITDPDNGGGQETVEPTGSGTADDPYNVAKVTEVTKALTADEFLENVYTKGYIVQIDDIDTNGTYGNATYWISDDVDGKTGKYEVYRGYGLGGEKFNAAGATIIKTGDLVVIKGKVKNFKGQTPEYDTGSIIVELNGVKAGGDTPTPSGETIGTKENPLTIDQALEKINALGDNAESTQFAFVKGKVVKVTTNQTNFDKYQNLNYLISEDGTDNGKTITVYSGDGLDGAKFTGITDLAQGDEVIVYGKLYKYVKDNKVTPEIAKGNYLVSLVKGSGGGGTPTPIGGSGSGTTADPYNVAGALAAAANLPEISNAKDANESNSLVDVVVKGVITNIKSIDTGQYGNAEYTISDDASGSNALLVYRGYGLNGEKFTSSEEIKVGDEVTIQGTIVNFKGTIEFTTGSKILSIGNNSGGGGQPSGGGSGTTADPYNVAAALAAAANLPEISNAKDANESNSLVDVVVKGVITNIKSIDTGQYGNAEYTISDDASGSNALLVYRGYGLNGEKFTSSDDIETGDKVTVQGTIVNFRGTIEFTSGSKILSIE